MPFVYPYRSSIPAAVAEYRARSREEVIAWLECRREGAPVYVMGRFKDGTFHIAHALSEDEARGMERTILNWRHPAGHHL